MTRHVLVIDNYDSFTFNLVQALGALGARVTVRRNDTVSVAEAWALAPCGTRVSISWWRRGGPRRLRSPHANTGRRTT